MRLVKYQRPYDVFDRFFNGFHGGFLPVSGYRSGDGDSGESVVARSPRANIEETKDSYVVVMEMPGLSGGDVSVSVEDESLIVKGEKLSKDESKDENGALRREIYSTKFERSFSLGNGVNEENIEAKMENGVLTITLPKKEEKVGRSIKVN